MNIFFVSRHVKDIDSVLGYLMMAGVIVAACGVIYLWGRHHHHARKSRRHH